ncbi:DUF1990 domain-containing protein [Streptacidiphilus sp. PB12-B1b]|uniref:DUF1990 family protein n=1 Tax=Streptacidiphilus sp. PB12-B1b TaxID=2705012 RepID=UPI0015F7BFB1|nr:DUF1990 domain-containing protein [Streptacidiphilus sp. PB12-B1b]QMU79576.1 DUF1990 domain-containing protein [Streptacidiphilus sp. PB12-B1b]
MDDGFSYPEVGATRPAAGGLPGAEAGPLPAGYRHLRHRTLIGSGPQVCAAAGEAVLSWRMHRAIGVRVTATDDRARPGVRVRVLIGRGGIGPAGLCEVVWAVEEPDRRGFGYGSLPGHPECGEEAFLVELAPDGRVWFTVTAFSRPACWYTRAAGPLVPLFQRLYARRCGTVLRRLAAPAAG